MKKTELKTGMVVECRNGDLYTVQLNSVYGQDGFVRGSDWISIESFCSDLIFHGDDKNRTEFARTVDIVKVYKPYLPTHWFKYPSKSDMKLLWERNECCEMTLSEICIALGKKIKVIPCN